MLCVKQILSEFTTLSFYATVKLLSLENTPVVLRSGIEGNTATLHKHLEWFFP